MLQTVPLYITTPPYGYAIGYSPLMPLAFGYSPAIMMPNMMVPCGYFSPPSMPQANMIHRTSELAMSEKHVDTSPKIIPISDDECSDIMDAGDPLLTIDIDVKQEFFISRLSSVDTMSQESPDTLLESEIIAEKSKVELSITPCIDSIDILPFKKCDKRVVPVMQECSGISIDSTMTCKALRDYRCVLTPILMHYYKYTSRNGDDNVNWRGLGAKIMEFCPKEFFSLAEEATYKDDGETLNFNFHGFGYKGNELIEPP